MLFISLTGQELEMALDVNFKLACLVAVQIGAGINAFARIN
jgi:hypothetical protein